MSKVSALLAVLLLAPVSPVLAADADQTAPLAVASPQSPFQVAPQTAARPRILPALYAGAAALQAFDVYSTLSGTARGAVEQNAVMRPLVEHPASFVAVKAGVAATSIYAAEKLWREHHKVAAIALMAASNGFMSYVAIHNAGVNRRLR